MMEGWEQQSLINEMKHYVGEAHYLAMWEEGIWIFALA